MKRVACLTLLVLLVALSSRPVSAVEGVIEVRSAWSVEVSADRMEQVLTKKGMTVFNRIKHSEAASRVGMELRETELILFGNPKVGSLLMKCAQSAAIDLPQKALIWKDATGAVWISYNAPRYLANRHGMTGCEGVITKIERALDGIAKAAASR